MEPWRVCIGLHASLMVLPVGCVQVGRGGGLARTQACEHKVACCGHLGRRPGQAGGAWALEGRRGDIRNRDGGRGPMRGSMDLLAA